ncbi:hypothetical protein ACP4OV_020544 [Aristida adscensionis]
MARCSVHAVHLWIAVLLSVIQMHVPAAAITVVPSSNCYTFDNESRIVDFTHLVGKEFEYNEKLVPRTDLAVEFCKDVQKRSQGVCGFIEFGRFVSSRYFLTGPEPIDYIQKFHYGDLVNCERTFKKMGRTAQVNIICGHCSNKECKDKEGCICNVSYDELMCRVVVELAIHCTKSGPRVVKGFSVGFHPRSSEIVYDGLTQLGFEQLHHGFSFQTEQIHVSLYLSAMSSLSGLIGKPTFKVNPAKGLGVSLTGSGVNGAKPTTLSPTVLNVDWRCEIARSSPYEVKFFIPVEGYDPIEFVLTKECGYTQEKETNPMKGWAIFGIISFVFVVLSSLLCCGGFIYKTRVEQQYGLDALPGMTIFSAFLDAVGRPRGYLRANSPTEHHASQASWERVPGTAHAAQSTNDRTYGSI